VDLIPKRFVAEGLLELMGERNDVAGASALYVTAEGARDALPDGLKAMGAEVTIIEAYRSIPDGQGAKRLSRAIEAGKVDLVTFTSASAVKAYVDAVGEELAVRVPAASIGPQTSEALREAGIELKNEAEESTIEGLVAAVVRGA
jgi:uroporphyrinogen-III synthase